mmetsp:Transcript_9575/g.14319  ORF Transcript_9575/g.14319 Transcript_9575/m.14319 type:complete len:97 (-) Transcript_9575:337-627(-)
MKISVVSYDASMLSISSNIEVIDLSLAGDHESHEPPLSCNVVLPILHGILHMRRVTLIQIPKAWRQDPLSDEFCGFLDRLTICGRMVGVCLLREMR